MINGFENVDLQGYEGQTVKELRLSKNMVLKPDTMVGDNWYKTIDDFIFRNLEEAQKEEPGLIAEVKSNNSQLYVDLTKKGKNFIFKKLDEFVGNYLGLDVNNNNGAMIYFSDLQLDRKDLTENGKNGMVVEKSDRTVPSIVFGNHYSSASPSVSGDCISVRLKDKSIIGDIDYKLKK